jgi:hypothetical protein
LGTLERANVDEDEVVAARLKAAIPGVTMAVLLVTGVLVLKSDEGLPCSVCITATTLGHGDKSTIWPAACLSCFRSPPVLSVWSS